MAVDPNNKPADEEVPNNYENLLDDYSHFAPPAADEVLQGRVVGITAKDVIVDFGYKSEGLVPIEQFQGPGGEVTVQPGDPVDVMIDHAGEQPEGYVLLSHTRAARLRIWDNLEKAYQEQLVISGRVLGPRQRRAGGGRGDQGLHARFAGRPAPGAQSRFPGGSGHSGQDHQAEPPPRQCGGLAQDGRGGRDHGPQDRHAGTSGRKARWSPAWSRTSPSTERSSISAASTACCMSPTFPTAA